jgi:hypothetical protein
MSKVQSYPKFRVAKDDGTPAVGWKLHSYEAGTSTPKATYTDQTGTTANANPVIMNSVGEASVWLTGSYKLVLTDENGVVKWTLDQVNAAEDGQFTSLTATGVVSLASLVVTGNETVNGNLTVNGSGTVLGVLGSTTALKAGTNPATTGSLRLPFNSPVTFRNAANTADVSALNVVSSDTVTLGASTVPQLNIDHDNTQATGRISLRGRVVGLVSSLGPDLAATPSVKLANIFTVTYSGAATITNFTEGLIGQEITIIFMNGNTTVQDNATVQLAGGTNFVGTTDDVLKLVYDGTTWREVSRSIN